MKEIPLLPGGGFALQPGYSMGYLVRDTSRLMLKALQEKIEPHGITLGQYFVMRELWEEEGLTQRELSGRVNIMEPSTVGALDALERGDFVMRVRSKLDRRKTHVFLTAKGRNLRSELLQLAADVNRAALAGIDEAAIATAASVLQRVKKNLAPSGPDPEET